MELAEALFSLAGFVVGGAVATGSAYLQYRWAANREDRRRAEDARLNRIQLEREVIADLIVALYGYLSSVVNLKLAYDAAGRGANLDVDRVREFQEVSQAFGPALVRARVTVRNPAALPALDDLQEQHVRMSSHLNLTALGQPSPEFVDHFREFHRVVGVSKMALEQAALTYEGALPAEAARRAAVEVKPRQRASAEASDGTRRLDPATDRRKWLYVTMIRSPTHPFGMPP